MKKTRLSNYLFEDAIPPPDPTPQGLEPAVPSTTTQMQDISLDQKVDHYLLQYERESSPNAPKMSPQNNMPIPSIPEHKIMIGKLLFEANDDPAAGGDAGGGLDALGDLGGGDTGGGGESGPSNAVPVPKLNLSVFAERAARLVFNYEALLDPRTTILNRVQAYISKNYSANMAKELMIQLQMTYGLSSANLQSRMDEPAPISSGAGLGDLSSTTPSGTSTTTGT